MFDRFRYSAENCSVHRTLDVVGEKWTFLVLREAYFGVRRFEDFAHALGCARNLLSRRLATLVEHGVLRREPYREPGMRERIEYALTPKGLELYPVLVALMQWGDRWSADRAGPAIVVYHHGCGAPVRATLACAAGHEGLAAQDTRVRPGPGARRMP